MLFASLLLAFLLFAIGTDRTRLRQALQAWRTFPWLLPAALLAVLPFLSLVLHERTAALDNLKLGYYWLIALGVFLAATCMAVVPWLRAFLAGLALVFAYAQLALLGIVPQDRGPSALGNYILYSQFLAIGIALLAILYRHEARQALRWIYLAGIAAFFAGLLTNNGRSGLLAVVVLLPLIFSQLFGNKGLGKVVLACLLALAVTLLSPRVQTRIEAAVNDIHMLRHNVTETSLGYRFDMWSTAVNVMQAHPLAGSGADGFHREWHRTERTGEAIGFREPHNAFLFFGSSYGLPGLLALFWLYAALLWTGWRQRHTLVGSLVLAFGIVCVLGSATNTMFVGAVSHTWLMMFIGLQGALLAGMMRNNPVQERVAA